MSYSDNIYHEFQISPRNGRKRRKPYKPFFVFHTAEAGKALNVIRYFDRLNNPGDRAAGYHTIVDTENIYHIINPGTHRAYQARHGGNDGIGLSMSTYAHKFRDGSLGLAGVAYVTSMARLY